MYPLSPKSKYKQKTLIIFPSEVIYYAMKNMAEIKILTIFSHFLVKIILKTPRKNWGPKSLKIPFFKAPESYRSPMG